MSVLQPTNYTKLKNELRDMYQIVTNMESHLYSEAFVITACSLVLLVLYSILRIIYSIWWKPIYTEKLLRRQGIRGTSHKLLRGDMGEMRRVTMQALSKPMSLNHRIAPRAVPFFHDMVQRYGKVCMSWTETRPRLIIGDSELIRTILADKNGHFVKTPQNPLVNLLQQGISSLEGEKWAIRRRLMTPAFHLDKLKGMLPAFSESCSNLIDRWTKLTSTTPQGTGEVDVAPELQILTTDVISRTAFGSSYDEGKKLFQLQKEQTVLVLEAYYNIFYIPGLRFVPTRKNRRRYELDREIKAILRDLIRKKEQEMQNKESGDDDDDDDVDLLGLLLQCKDGSNNCMTIDDVLEECKLFYIAGQETSASLLTWTMVVLSMHPDWQQKAREEVLLLCGKRAPDFNAINHLKIVTMILNEVLRLYPPLTVLLRYTKQETSIGGLSIPAGVETLLFVLSLHLDPKCWGDDAEQFNPERFSEGVARSSKDNHNQTVFYPFGWGPRICLGQNFAMIEVKMALAMILQHFSFELSPSYTHAPCVGLTLQPQYGAPLILHRL